MTQTLYLGVDGGGTGTRVLLADRSGRVQGVGYAGSTNRNHYPRERVQANLRDAIRAALGDVAQKNPASVSTLFLGVGGVSTEADRRDVRAVAQEIPEIGPDVRVVVENDTRVGLTGGLSGRPGVALVAGTGSACFGVNGRGEKWLCGGWGALADDVGSAPWVGLRALQAAVQAEDGRLAPTRLRDIVFEFLGLTEPRQFISRVHNDGLERAELGRLAPLVAEAYRDGDAAAGAILHDAAASLTALAAVTVRRLFGDAPCELILVGGLALSGAPFQPMLTDRLEREMPSLSVRAPEMSPVQGAVLEALRTDGQPWTEQVIANLSSFRLSPKA